MKSKFNWLRLLRLSVLALCLFPGLNPVPSLASPAPTYEGSFQANPEPPHSGPISGKMSLLMNGSQLSEVDLSLDQPVFGSSAYASIEQWLGTAGSGAAPQTAVVFKLQGPPHTWYFVLIASSSDGGITLQGTLFSANATMQEIQAAVKNPASGTPANWQSIGSATLKKQ